MIEEFGQTAHGAQVHAITLKHQQLSARILTYGGILQEIKHAHLPFSLTLGYPTLDGYLEPAGAYVGALVGPLANRLAAARFEIGDQPYSITANEGPNLLHSGAQGLHQVNWGIKEHSEDHVILQTLRAAGADGFPGNRRIELRYQLTGESTLELTLSATTDQATVMNIAQHAYWNLDGIKDISGHDLCVFADHYLPTDAQLLPLAPASLDDTAFDHRQPMKIGAAVGPRLDHNFYLSQTSDALRPAARLTGANGFQLHLETSEPGLQVYDGAGLNGSGFGAFAGIALEPQRWPNAPHNSWLGQTALHPNETYQQKTRWSFRPPV